MRVSIYFFIVSTNVPKCIPRVTFQNVNMREEKILQWSCVSTAKRRLGGHRDMAPNILKMITLPFYPSFLYGGTLTAYLNADVSSGPGSV